jgi:hypothetical protein
LPIEKERLPDQELPEIGSAGREMRAIVKLAEMEEKLEQISNNENMYHAGR